MNVLIRLQWAVFGTMQSTVTILLIAALFICSSCLEGAARQLVAMIGGAALGTEYVSVLFKFRVLYKYSFPVPSQSKDLKDL